MERLATKNNRYAFLAELKWKDGHECSRCGHGEHIKGKRPHGRRCGRCGFDESTASGTLFHKLEFGIDKAFGMPYEVATSKKKGADSIWPAERFGADQKTPCSLGKRCR